MGKIKIIVFIYCLTILGCQSTPYESTEITEIDLVGTSDSRIIRYHKPNAIIELGYSDIIEEYTRHYEDPSVQVVSADSSLYKFLESSESNTIEVYSDDLTLQNRQENLHIVWIETCAVQLLNKGKAKVHNSITGQFDNQIYYKLETWGIGSSSGTFHLMNDSLILTAHMLWGL